MAERRQNSRRETDQIASKLDEIETILTEHLKDADIRFAVLDRAFPDGPDAHRAAHEAMIRAAQSEERFWLDLRLDLAKKGIWSIILVLIGLVFFGLSVKLGWNIT